MSDTQWPRYVVFEQDFPNNPHRLAGSVHAPDAEMALLNARDVFVRRPTVISLWVVPADTIFAKTAEELAKEPGWADDLPTPEAAPEPYLVFAKLDHRSPPEYLGEVIAADGARALLTAMETFADQEPIMWWTLPARRVTRSTPEDIELLFEQAKEKPFRHQSNFRVQTRLREMMDRQTKDGD